MVKLTQVRIYSNAPDQVAKFYATLGYEVEGPVEPRDEPDDFPLYYIPDEGGPDIAIFRRKATDPPNAQEDATLFFFRVERDPTVIKDNLQQLSLYRQAEEPRSYCGKIDAIRDPEGRLVGLDTSFLSRLAEVAKERPWTSTIQKRYNVGEIAIYDGNRYECLRDHMAQEDNPPAKLSQFWRLIGSVTKATFSKMG